MAQQIADRRDIDFVLHEQLGVEKLSEHEIFAEFNRKTVDLIVSEARNLSIKEILPTQIDGDREGTRFENGKVFVPESFHKAWELFKEGEWLAMTEDPEYGGQGMPHARVPRQGLGGGHLDQFEGTLGLDRKSEKGEEGRSTEGSLQHRVVCLQERRGGRHRGRRSDCRGTPADPAWSRASGLAGSLASHPRPPEPWRTLFGNHGRAVRTAGQHARPA